MYLNSHTYYSLKYGTLSPTQLVEAAAARGIKSLVLSDINNTSCSYQFIQACKVHDIKPILGIEFRQATIIDQQPLVDDDDKQNKKAVEKLTKVDYQLSNFLYVAIAKNKEGWRELNELQTRCSLEKTPLPEIAPDFQHAYVIYRKLPKGKNLSDLRDNEFIGVRPEEVNRLFSSYLKEHLDKLVIFSPITSVSYTHLTLPTTPYV